mmetsp:Transcript_13033/g.27571  ORF Transcript_13033/g.27571 Transcript_13033/m.27571 type:complete len:167 (-) Transcript_13033:268-768(-)
MLSLTSRNAFTLPCAHTRHVQSRTGRLHVVSLRKGIVVEAKPPKEGKLDLRVRIDADVTGKAYDEALRELGRSVELPGQRKRKGGKATPLPKGMIISLVGKKKINRFVVDGLITESVCDYAAENNLQVPSDLSAAGVVEDIEGVRTSFVAGEDLEFEASTSVRAVE